MRVKIFLILFLVLLVSGVLADEGPLQIYNTDCKKDGSLTLSFDSNEKIYTKDIDIKAEYIGDLVGKSKFDMIGEWNSEFISERSSEKETTFTSEEVLFKLRGEYLIIVDYMYNSNSYATYYKAKCPGFEFSCSLISVYIDYCRNINNERFEASARIYGLGDVTKENLNLDNNIQFILHAEKSYGDIKGKFSKIGSLPKDTEINNPKYEKYYFNVSLDNKIEKFVAKFIGINYIEGGCANYPNISLYAYEECENVILEDKEEEKDNLNESKQEEVKPTYIGQVIKNQEIIKELERDVGTKEANESKWHLIILFVILGLCITGTIYVIIKRNFNKEPNW